MLSSKHSVKDSNDASIQDISPSGQKDTSPAGLNDSKHKRKMVQFNATRSTSQRSLWAKATQLMKDKNKNISSLQITKNEKAKRKISSIVLGNKGLENFDDSISHSSFNSKTPSENNLIVEDKLPMMKKTASSPA